MHNQTLCVEDYDMKDLQYADRHGCCHERHEQRSCKKCLSSGKITKNCPLAEFRLVGFHRITGVSLCLNTNNENLFNIDVENILHFLLFTKNVAIYALFPHKIKQMGIWLVEKI